MKNGAITLVEGRDYEVIYTDNIDAGIAKVSVTGKGDYSGTMTREFTINIADQTLSADISTSNIQVGKTAQINVSAKTDVSYSSSDANIATVSDSGVITGNAVGTATITVTANASRNYNKASKTLEIMVCGTCGKNLMWSMKNSTLIILGSGEMDDYQAETSPWNGMLFNEVIIKEGVESIGANAFRSADYLRNIDIPASVSRIGECAFPFMNLENISVAEKNEGYCSVNGVLLNKKKTELLCYPADKKDTDYTIPSGVERIGSMAFFNCRNIRNVTVPNSVTRIGESAFKDCSVLANVKISNSVTNIDSYAFSGCYNLANVVIPEGVKSVGAYAFSGCVKLTSFAIPDSVTNIGEGMLQNCDHLASVTIGSNVTSIASGVFVGCSSLTSITIPDSVTSIGGSAFAGCTSLANITLSNNTASIEAYTFEGCYKLSHIEIPDSVTEIGESAFRYCGLMDITIPSSVTRIKYGAFQDCDSLISVRILAGVTRIEYNTFSGCSSLTNITIPDSVAGIDLNAFRGCENLSNVYYSGNEVEWTNISVGKSNDALKNATIHYNSTGPTDPTDPTDPTEKVISTCTINLEKTSYTYDGKAKQPTVTVKDGSTTLTSGKDYEVTYADNLDAGTAKVTITGKGDYSGSVTKEFTIQKANQTLSASISASSILVGGTAQITASAKTGMSYSSSDTKVAAVSASGVVTAKAVGTATITVTAKASKNYNEASKKVTVTVTEKSIPVTQKLSACKVTLAKTSYTYDGKAKKPAVTVKDGGTTLTNGKDYEVAYANNINAGTARVTVTGKGNYTGTVTMNVVIKKAASVITASHITKATSAKAQKASIGAKVKGGAKLTYKSNNKYVTVDKKGQVTIAKKFVGQATITITAAATKNYNAGTKKVTVTVNPASTKLSSVKNSASKSMKVAWKKNAAVTGYQVQYATAKNFKSAKTVAVKKAKTTSTTVKKLTKGKKYYVRIRTYQKVGGKTYYSAWSASKNVTIKK